MVGRNWFLPEILSADGSGIPLSAFQDVTGLPIENQPLHLGQPCCALLKSAASSWKTSMDASGIFLFSLGQFPVRIDLPGGVAVAVDVALRPEAWRRGFDGGSQGSGLLEDRAIRLRCYAGSAVVAESWTEWGDAWANPSGVDIPGQGESWQLAAGWCSNGTVYAHLLPHYEYGFLYDNIGEPDYASREFGIGASASISLPEAFSGPGRISVTTGGPLESWSYDQPCRWFTGHILPLGKTIPYLPDFLSPAARLEATPSARFGWLRHVAPACVMHSRVALSFSEADRNYEWCSGGSFSAGVFFYGLNQFGPRHLAAIQHYAYTDHAVVPDNGDTLCNLSPTRSENEVLRRISATWTVNKASLWPLGPGANAPSGQFSFQDNLEGHGAWGEWSSRGMVATNQSASVASDTGPGTLYLDITSFSISLAIRRHTFANYATLTGPGDADRQSLLELRASVWCSGRYRLTGQGAANFDVPWQSQLTVADPVYLSQAAANTLFGGGPTTVTASPGSLEIAGLGPP